MEIGLLLHYKLLATSRNENNNTTTIVKDGTGNNTGTNVGCVRRSGGRSFPRLQCRRGNEGARLYDQQRHDDDVSRPEEE